MFFRVFDAVDEGGVLNSINILCIRLPITSNFQLNTNLCIRRNRLEELDYICDSDERLIHYKDVSSSSGEPQDFFQEKG
jgi:hypothetical protein